MEAKKKKPVSKKKVAKKPVAKKAVKKADNSDIVKLAARIKAIRKSLGYTNADFFAYENGISRSQYARYENGEDIRYSSLMKIIKAFKMTPEQFFSEEF